MRPDRLAQIGQALFGDHWREPMAALLGVNERTVRRWRDESRDIPEGIWPVLKSALAAKRREIDALMR